MLSCWDLSAETVTAYQRNNFNEVNGDNEHIEEVNGNDENIREVNGNDENIKEVNNDKKNTVEANGDDENIREVNIGDENIGEVNKRRDSFVNQTCEADHFEGKRRENFGIQQIKGQPSRRLDKHTMATVTQSPVAF